MIRLATSVLVLGALAVPAAAETGKSSSGAGPVIVVDTGKGTIEFETYPNEAPKTVAHITALANTTLSDSQRRIPLEADGEIQQVAIAGDVEHRHDLANPETDLGQRRRAFVR